MPPIQEHGYEGDFGYGDADWDAGRPWDRQDDGWHLQSQRQVYDSGHQQVQHQHGRVGYAPAAHNGVYDRYENSAVAASRPRINYAGRMVAGPAAPAPDWPPSHHITSHASLTAATAGVAGITTPPRHLRKLPQIPKPAELTQKLQQQKQLMGNNIG